MVVILPPFLDDGLQVLILKIMIHKCSQMSTFFIDELFE